MLSGKAAAMRFHAAPMSKGLLAAAAATTPAQHHCQLRGTARALSQYMQLISMPRACVSPKRMHNDPRSRFQLARGMRE